MHSHGTSSEACELHCASQAITNTYVLFLINGISTAIRYCIQNQVSNEMQRMPVKVNYQLAKNPRKYSSSHGIIEVTSSLGEHGTTREISESCNLGRR